MKAIREFFRSMIKPEHPDGIIRVTWFIFICTAPFLANLAWRMNWLGWVVSLGFTMWAFSFANAYLNRLYWKSYLQMIRREQEMLNEIQTGYYLLHEHCPSCGRRLKAPPEVRQ